MTNLSPSEAEPQKRIILTTPDDTIQLRQLIPSDSEPYFALVEYDREHLSQHGDTTAQKYQTLGDVADSIVHPSNPQKYRFGIWDGDVMVGSDNLTPTDDNRAELGSWVGKEHTGNGYAARARVMLVDFAFNTLGLDEVFCNVTVGNEPSRRSVEGSGFTFKEEKDGQWVYVLANPARQEVIE